MAPKSRKPDTDIRLTALRAADTPRWRFHEREGSNEVASRGVVAAGHPRTAAAACAVLAEGGSAVDAALAGLLAACVAEPVLASLGGGGFLIALPADGRHAGRPIVYDFFVQTPRQRRPPGEIDFREVAADFGPARQTFHIGLGTIATPGVVKGIFAAHRDLGRMPIRRLFEPAVALAKDGVLIDGMQAYVLGVVRAIIEADPRMRALFESPTGSGALLREGERLIFPQLADALESIAVEGDDLFYRGEMGRLLSDDSQSKGGHLTHVDLERYQVERRPPLTLSLFDANVLLNPPPSSGGLLVGFGLKLWQALERTDARFGSSAHLGRLVTIMRATERARIEERVHERVADPAAAEMLLDPLLIARWLNELSGLAAALRGTTQISVVDAAGGVASLSVSNGEGSAYVLPQTDIILNNMLGESDLLTKGPEAWPRDRRLSSMMTPSIVREANGGIMALGSGGSNRIRTAMLQVLLNLLTFRMDPEEAIGAPRIHYDENILSMEPGFRDEAVMAACAGAQFKLEAWPAKNLFFGGVHLAQRSAQGALLGVGDARRGGAACGA
jgi:gamma-glutamyltranspeptidase/glutathione hydrolase